MQTTTRRLLTLTREGSEPITILHRSQPPIGRLGGHSISVSQGGHLPLLDLSGMHEDTASAELHRIRRTLAADGYTSPTPTTWTPGHA